MSYQVSNEHFICLPIYLQNVTERRALRTKLECKPFDWYLRNVWPDHFLPTTERFYGKIMVIDINSKLYNDYLDLLSEIDVPAASTWTGLIEFFNRNVHKFSQLSAELVMYSLQQPKGHGVLNQPFGQAIVKNCTLYDYDQDAFVIKSDGHVSGYIMFCLYFFITTFCGLLIKQQTAKI